MSDAQPGDPVIPPPVGDPLKFGWLLIATATAGIVVVVILYLVKGAPWLLLFTLGAIPNYYTGIKSIRAARKAAPPTS